MNIDRENECKSIIDNIRGYLLFVPDGEKIIWDIVELFQILFRKPTSDEIVNYKNMGLGIPYLVYDPLLKNDELRKIDLRKIEFFGIDVRFKDFSYLNVIIDQESVYASSLEGCNLEGVKVLNRKVGKTKLKKNNKSYK